MRRAVELIRDEGMSVTDAARAAGVAPASIYRSALFKALKLPDSRRRDMVAVTLRLHRADHARLLAAAGDVPLGEWLAALVTTADGRCADGMAVPDAQSRLSGVSEQASPAPADPDDSTCPAPVDPHDDASPAPAEPVDPAIAAAERVLLMTTLDVDAEVATLLVGSWYSTVESIAGSAGELPGLDAADSNTIRARAKAALARARG